MSEREFNIINPTNGIREETTRLMKELLGFTRSSERFFRDPPEIFTDLEGFSNQQLADVYLTLSDELKTSLVKFRKNSKET